MTSEQISLAESAFIQLGVGNDNELPLAVEHWIADGRQTAVAKSAWIDDAVKDFLEWLPLSELRPGTKDNLRWRVRMFGSFAGKRRVCDVTPEVIDSFLDARSISPVSKDNDRRAISKFFTWCMDRPRRWTASNPCHAVKVKCPRRPALSILSLAECEKVLEAAEKIKGGKMAPYIAVCLFGGLRPSEARRLDWSAVNLADREIRLDASQTKTNTGRTVEIRPPLAAWLKAYKDQPFCPKNWRGDLRRLLVVAGFGTPTEKHPDLKPWPHDVMRHTAISHFFRKTKSFGDTAEQFGNSEAIIKKHYMTRVSSEETKAFYALLPKR
jgi:integrase